MGSWPVTILRIAVIDELFHINFQFDIRFFRCGVKKVVRNQKKPLIYSCLIYVDYGSNIEGLISRSAQFKICSWHIGNGDER